jgi:hypothetical protein
MALAAPAKSFRLYDSVAAGQRPDWTVTPAVVLWLTEGSITPVDYRTLMATGTASGTVKGRKFILKQLLVARKMPSAVQGCAIWAAFRAGAPVPVTIS